MSLVAVAWYSNLLNLIIIILGLMLMLIVLIQRGKGIGLGAGFAEPGHAQQHATHPPPVVTEMLACCAVSYFTTFTWIMMKRTQTAAR